VVSVRYDDVLLAFEFVSSAPSMENNAYISRDTGEIHWTSELNPIDEDVPDDLETSDRYIAVPHKNDLDLGRDLALRFAAQELPEYYERVQDFFRRKGAYARFKQLLELDGLLEQWYKFEARSVETALREWCAENNIDLHDSSDETAT
jgi:hypothetical protein